jgi:hypothetical protein
MESPDNFFLFDLRTAFPSKGYNTVKIIPVSINTFLGTHTQYTWFIIVQIYRK